MMKRETVLTYLCIVLSVALIVMVVYGCKRCTHEGFEDAPDAKKDAATDDAPGSTALAPHENELFEALMKNDIADDKIQQLIKGGVLNEKLVERFLAKLDEGSGAAPAKDADTKAVKAVEAPAKKVETKAVKAVKVVEAFKGGRPSTPREKFTASPDMHKAAEVEGFECGGYASY